MPQDNYIDCSNGLYQFMIAAGKKSAQSGYSSGGIVSHVLIEVL